MLPSCTGWVPFLWADYGDRTGFTQSQWANTDADVGDLEEWSVGVGFAYGGFLPGLMQEQAPQPPEATREHRPPAQDDMDEKGMLEAVGRWPWYTALSLFLTAGLVWLILRKRKNSKS